MFGSIHNGANSYAKVGMETGVIAASPHKLISMLFDGALLAVANAQQQMKAKNIPAKGAAISKAINIVDNGLRASLDLEAGGQLAVQLDSLYEYMSRRLLTANMQNDLAMLQEVHQLLSDLKAGWDGISDVADQTTASNQAQPATASVPAKPSAYDAIAPRSSTFVSA